MTRKSSALTRAALLFALLFASPLALAEDAMEEGTDDAADAAEAVDAAADDGAAAQDDAAAQGDAAAGEDAAAAVEQADAQPAADAGDGADAAASSAEPIGGGRDLQ